MHKTRSHSIRILAPLLQWHLLCCAISLYKNSAYSTRMNKPRYQEAIGVNRMKKNRKNSRSSPPFLLTAIFGRFSWNNFLTVWLIGSLFALKACHVELMYSNCVYVVNTIQTATAAIKTNSLLKFCLNARVCVCVSFGAMRARIFVCTSMYYIKI